MEWRLLTFIAVVVEIDEVGLEIAWQSRDIHSIPMVLACDMAASSSQVQRGDIVSAVAILELDSFCTSRQSEQLVTQADAEDRDLA